MTIRCKQRGHNPKRLRIIEEKRYGWRNNFYVYLSGTHMEAGTSVRVVAIEGSILKVVTSYSR